VDSHSNIVKQVAADFGGRPALANFLGVRQQAIQSWVSAGYFPPGRAIELERRCPDRYKAVDLAESGSADENDGSTKAA